MQKEPMKLMSSLCLLVTRCHCLSISSSSKNPTSTISHNSVHISDNIQKAIIFNQYFNSVFTKPVQREFDNPVYSCSELNSLSFTTFEVFASLNSLDPTKGSGCDNIGPNILKFCSSALASPLARLFSMCMDQHSIPNEWKHHLITPIPNSGNLSCVENYKPISLLCVTSKALESLIYNKVIDFIQPKLSSSQYGFLKIDHALLSF